MSPSPSPREHTGVRALLLLSLAVACGEDPYAGLKAENVGLGPIDPVTVPAENLGTDGNRIQQGAGTFTEIPAMVAGEVVGYFAYPMKTPATRDPLRLLDDGRPYATTPTAYAFDATDEAPIPDANKCQPPAGYRPNKRLDPAPGWYNHQHNIFTDLPRATYNPGVASASTYIPVVAEARTSSSGRVCQDLKSEKGLSTALGGKLPKPSGRFLAWLIIDPGAAVFSFDDAEQDPKNSILLQEWGWYNRYFIAYLDGGLIPVADAQVPISAMDPTLKTVTRMVPQKLYFPRGPIAVPAPNPDPMAPQTMTVMGRIGAGFDVLTAKRGADGYSPICEVWSYLPAPAPPPPMTAPPFPVENLPKDAAAIEMMFPAPNLTPGMPRYVFCLQVVKPQ